MRLDKHTLAQGWNSLTRQEIRGSLNNGVRHPNCQDCWAEEDAGRLSQRNIVNERFKDVVAYQEQPRVFMLKPGNACNLACRHCNPHVSSGWYKDHHKLTATGSFVDYVKTYNYIRDGYTQDSDVWTTLGQWNDNIVYYDLYGAEPLLIEPLLELLRSGNSEQTVHVNTNGTIWQDDFNEVFGKFKHVELGVSIDAIGEQFEYMRYPAKWDHLLANLLKYKLLAEKYPSIDLSVCITASVLNVYYLAEYVQFFHNLGIEVGINFVHRPDYLNMRILPTKVKQKVISKLHSAGFANGWDSKIDHIINFLMLDHDASEQLMTEMWAFTNSYDTIRKQNYADTFKEFYEILNE
jgi:sulfatase maturation enzyme AslB (radical SAM superfamily)